MRDRMDGGPHISHDLLRAFATVGDVVADELQGKIGRLKTRIDALRDTPALEHRLRRAASWLERGVGERDTDAKYVFLWIAFNAAYAVEPKSEPSEDASEARRREGYFRALVRLDTEERIYKILATKLRPRVQDIMSNVYVFRGFWDCLTEGPFDWRDWPNRRRFERDRAFVDDTLGYTASSPLQAQLRAVAVVPDGDVAEVLVRLFHRLYVLRNQFMHGCATQDGHLNRRQVDAGAAVLEPLVCEFLDVMAANPEKDWGPLAYPVRDDIREDRHGTDR